jgi:hypothetical protein
LRRYDQEGLFNELFNGLFNGLFIGDKPVGDNTLSEVRPEPAPNTICCSPGDGKQEMSKRVKTCEEMARYVQKCQDR